MPFGNHGGAAGTVDHFFPRAYSGPDHPHNYVGAHESCNKLRGNRMPTEGDMRKFIRIRGEAGRNGLRMYAARLEQMTFGVMPS